MYLHLSSDEVKYSFVKSLLDIGADIDATISNDKTVLTYLVSDRYDRTLEVCLSC